MLSLRRHLQSLLAVVVADSKLFSLHILLSVVKGFCVRESTLPTTETK